MGIRNFLDIFCKTNTRGSLCHIIDSDITMTHSILNSNRALTGGFMLVEGESKLKILSNKFLFNTGLLGGIFKINSFLIININGNIFYGNTAINYYFSQEMTIRTKGGCIYFGKIQSGKIELKFSLINNIFKGNQAFCGGILYSDGTDNDILIKKFLLFEWNNEIKENKVIFNIKYENN